MKNVAKIVAAAVVTLAVLVYFSARLTNSKGRNCVSAEFLRQEGRADSLAKWLDRKITDGSVRQRLPLRDGRGNGDYSIAFDLLDSRYGLKDVEAQVVLDAHNSVVAVQLIDTLQRSIVIATRPHGWYAWSDQALIVVTPRVAVVCPSRD